MKIFRNGKMKKYINKRNDALINRMKNRQRGSTKETIDYNCLSSTAYVKNLSEME